MLILLAVLLALVVLPGCSDTSTSSSPPALVVPDQFPTIQAAIDAARPGEIVLVQPGVYSTLERRDVDPDRYPGGLLASAFLKEGVGLVGNGDPGTVVLRDSALADSSVGVVFSQLSSVPFIDNLTVENYATGVLISRGEGTVQFLRVIDCRIGLHLREPFDPIIRNNLFEGDSLGVLVEAGGGYLAANIIRGCTVGGHLTTGALSWLEANAFCTNGTGLILDGGAAPTLTVNSITSNQGSGLETGDGAFPDLVATPRGAGVPFAAGNDIFDNGVDFVVTGYSPPLPQPFPATGQWWNTTDTTAAGAGIVDDRTDPGRGATVEYVPIAPFSFFEYVFGEGARAEKCAPSTPLSTKPYPLP
jgi:hypothetical protein